MRKIVNDRSYAFGEHPFSVAELILSRYADTPVARVAPLLEGPASSPSVGGPVADAADPAANAADAVADARERLQDALTDLGVEPHARAWFADAAETVGALATGRDLTGAAGPGGESGVGAPDRAELVAAGSEVLDRIGALTFLTSHLQSALVRTAGELSVRTGRILLADKGVTSPAELSATARRRWRSRARSTAAAEITAFTGLRPGESADLVNLATSPPEVVDTVTASMANGVSPWTLARPFFRATGDLAHEDAAHVATVLFGDDPDTVAEERLDPEGDLRDEPWNHQEFRRALDREVQAIRSRDPEAAREARERARERRDIRVKAHSDGTGQVIINGTAAQAVAVNDRMERAARRARALGDERTLGQLRSDLAMSLLLHSRLNLPDLPEDPDLVTTEHTDQLSQVLLALPQATLDVIVPFAALLHDPNQPLPGFATQQAPADTKTTAAGHTTGDTRATPDQGGNRLSGIQARLSAMLQGGADLFATRAAAEAGLYSETLFVGQAHGAHPYFLTADEVRDLALQPGTVMHHLLTDPASGRCVERSIKSYTPDGLMRAQIHAADITCRAPGCVQHASYSQLDHVEEWPEGATSETNLQKAHDGHHHLKTSRCWDAVMDPKDRAVTWRTLLDRVYRTRVHDYRQYTRLYQDAVRRVEERTRATLDDPTASAATKKHARSDAIDQAVIEALAWRDPGQPLGSDEGDGSEDSGFQAWATTILSHTTPDGQRRMGPAPEVLEAERRRQRQSAEEVARDPKREEPSGNQPHGDDHEEPNGDDGHEEPSGDQP